MFKTIAIWNLLLKDGWLCDMICQEECWKVWLSWLNVSNDIETDFLILFSLIILIWNGPRQCVNRKPTFHWRHNSLNGKDDLLRPKLTEMSRVDEDEGWWCALQLLTPGALRKSQETLFRLFYIVGLSLRFPETPNLYLLIEGDPIVDMCSELSSVEWASQEVQLYLLTSRWNESSWTGMGRCRLRRRADEHAVPPKGEAVPAPQTGL